MRGVCILGDLACGTPAHSPYILGFTLEDCAFHQCGV
jgi:hypothetical protein